MNLKQLSLSCIAGFCLTLPCFIQPIAFADSPKTATTHWAKPILESLQAQKLFLTLEADSKAFSQPVSDKTFQALLSELWLSETITLPKESADTTLDNKLTREEAAERIYAAFKPHLDSKTSNAIDWVKSVGIMKGYPDGGFKKDEVVSLAQGVATMKNIKDYLKESPDLVYKIGHADPSNTSKLSYSAQPNASGKLDLVLSWGEKHTGGYSITITETKVIGKELHVYYKTTSPGPDDFVTQALTYPKATVTLDMSVETYKQYTVILHEIK